MAWTSRRSRLSPQNGDSNPEPTTASRWTCRRTSKCTSAFSKGSDGSTLLATYLVHDFINTVTHFLRDVRAPWKCAWSRGERSEPPVIIKFMNAPRQGRGEIVYSLLPGVRFAHPWLPPRWDGIRYRTYEPVFLVWKAGG